MSVSRYSVERRKVYHELPVQVRALHERRHAVVSAD